MAGSEHARLTKLVARLVAELEVSESQARSALDRSGGLFHPAKQLLVGEVLTRPLQRTQGLSGATPACVTTSSSLSAAVSDVAAPGRDDPLVSHLVSELGVSQTQARAALVQSGGCFHPAKRLL